jgi:YidC/Oxa1 family membrane protein insertase
MDRKTVLLLVASFGALFLWQWLVSVWYPPTPKPLGATNAMASASNALTTNATATTTNVAPAAVAPPTNATISINMDLPEDVVVVTNSEAIYIFTTQGGGVKQVQLLQYPETVGCDLSQGTNGFATLNQYARVPILAMQAGDALGDNNFKLTRTSPNSISAEKVLLSGLRVLKVFDIGSNYQITARLRVENTSAQAMILPEQQVSAGTATPMGPRDDMSVMGVFWYNGQKPEHIEHSWFNDGGGWFKKSAPRLSYASGPNRILWAAAHNQFFTLSLVATNTNSYGGHFMAHRIDLPKPTASEIAFDSKVIRDPHGIEALVGYPAVTLAPGQALERQFTIYAGPKQEKLLARLGRGTDAIMDFGFFSPISKVMLRLMNVIHSGVAAIVPEKLGKYAMALVLMTILIKLVFWPLTAKSTRSMKKMQALSPELKKIQEKYKDDPMKMNKQVMAFWKEHGVSPMSGCWPMMIQMPIFFGLFYMIRSAIELRGQPFLWACDLSKPDTVFMIPGLNFPFNPLPLIMGVTMFVQARMTPASPGMDPAQQAMMKYMPLIFLVFLYQQPAGLTLYWTVQNLLTIVQTKLTKTKDEPAAAPAPPAPEAPHKKKKKK